MGILVRQVGVVEPGGMSRCALLVWLQARIIRGVTPSCNEALGFRGVVWELEKRLATMVSFTAPLLFAVKSLTANSLCHGVRLASASGDRR